MHKIYRFYVYFTCFITTLYSRFLFQLMKVKFGEKFVCNGILRIKSKGEIVIGNDVKINSSYTSSPIGSNVFTSIIVNEGAKLLIGDRSGLSNCYIYSRNYVSIGQDVYLGGGCHIYDTDFHSIYADVRKDPLDLGVAKPVLIGDNVFIGANTIILKGSTISNNSVVGAGSLVSGFIPPNQIWGGNPVKYIKDIEVV